MPTDHPDGTRPIVISRADIQTPIDIQHQTTNVKTNFKEQEVGVHIEAEWEVKQEKDKVFRVSNLAINYAEYTYVEYIVPVDKTLYLCCMGFVILAAAVADYDHPLVGECYIYNATDVEVLNRIGGNGGNGLAFPEPIVIPGGEKFRGAIGCFAGVTCSMFATFLGYEI